MKLATLRDGTRDGQLIVVSRDNSRFVSAAAIAQNLQAALDEWSVAHPRLLELSTQLNAGQCDSEPLDTHRLMAPLPRAYEWVDGSAYINHIMLVRKARGAEMPPTLRTDPLVYQGGSSVMLAPNEAIHLADSTWGLDFESEIAVVLDDTPQGTSKSQAANHVRLLMLANDVTLRHLVPDELAKSFGFFQSKPATAFSPFAVTPDELGEAWQEGRVQLPLRTTYNGTLVGDPNAGPEMHFSFYDLIAHICKTRAFGAGTIVGSGTVSNADRERGISCLAERRMLEIIETGKAQTAFMKAGDTIAIEMFNASGQSIFGRIEQKVVEGKQEARR